MHKTSAAPLRLSSSSLHISLSYSRLTSVMNVRAKEGKKEPIFLVCLSGGCNTLGMNFLLPYTACLACDVHKLQIQPIFSGRKLSCLAPSPGLPADETLVVQTAFYPTWRVSALTCEIHKLWTVPYNHHSQSMLIPLAISGGRRNYKDSSPPGLPADETPMASISSSYHKVHTSLPWNTHPSWHYTSHISNMPVCRLISRLSPSPSLTCHC